MLFYGLGLAIVIGIPVAVLMARVRPVDWALDLPINALYATPMVALVPILVLWFGIYLKAKVLVVFLFAVFPILINTYQGVRECDKNMLEVARSFRSSEWQMWKDVLLPFALPYIAAGIRLAIGRGLVGMVIAEFYTTISGLGFMITRYANIFEMDKTFVPVILLMFLGVALTAAPNGSSGASRRGTVPRHDLQTPPRETPIMTATATRELTGPSAHPAGPLPRIRVRGLAKRYGGAAGLSRHRFQSRRARYPDNRRSLGMRQDHVVALADGLLPVDVVIGAAANG